MIYVTGDTHGELSINRLGIKTFPQGKNLTKDDYVIICGDFGLVFFNKTRPSEKYWLDWLEEKPWTTIVVGGNHENYNKIEAEFPIEKWNGAKVRFIRRNIIWVERGEIIKLNGLSIFCFGGAPSLDKSSRVPNVSWWERELPNKEEYDNAFTNLAKYDYTVDYCITHEAPSFIKKLLYYHSVLDDNSLSNFLDKLDKEINCIHWFHGHLHRDLQVNKLHTLLYNNIIEIKTKQKGE